jgi:hypothetical protein
MQFELTPKVLTNFSPELERSDNSGVAHTNNETTLKGFATRGTLSGFQRPFGLQTPGLSLCSNPGLKLANAFGVFQTASLHNIVAV